MIRILWILAPPAPDLSRSSFSISSRVEVFQVGLKEAIGTFGGDSVLLTGVEVTGKVTA